MKKRKEGELKTKQGPTKEKARGEKEGISSFGGGEQENGVWRAGDSREKPWWRAFVEVRSAGVGAGLLVFGSWSLSPARGLGGFFLCPFLQMTGWPCPFCGLTRSLAAWSQGRVGLSFALHPLGWLVGVACLGLFFLAISPERWRLSWLRRLDKPSVEDAITRFLGGVGLVFLGVWLLRLGLCGLLAFQGACVPHVAP